MKIFDFLHGLVLSMFLSSWLCISFATPVNNVERYANIKNEVNHQQRCRLSAPKLSYAVNHRHLLHDLDEDNNEFFDTDQQNNEIENITETVKSQECCNHESNQVSLTESISNNNNNIDSSNINKDNNQKQNEEPYLAVNSRKDTSKSNDKEVHSRRKRSLSNSKELHTNKMKENVKRSMLTNKSQGKSSLKSSSHNEQELDNKAVDSNSDENEPLNASDNADYVGEVDGTEYQRNQVSLMSNEDNSINQDEKSFYDEFEGKEIVKRDADDPKVDYEGAKTDEEGNEENASDNRIKRDEEVDIKFKDQPVDAQLPREGSLDERSVDSKPEEEVADRSADNLKEEENDVSKPNFIQDIDNSKSLTNDKILNEEGNGVYERAPSILDDRKFDTELNKNLENNKLEIKPQNVAVGPSLNVPLKSEMKSAELKGEDSEAEYEKRVEEQIQRKIDSIKEEIKREIEEKQRLKEIEANNAKFDELQKQLEENEERQNLEEQKTDLKHIASKRSAHRTNQVKKKRSLKKIKRSEQEKNVRELRKIENVDNLNSDVYRAALVDHESIRKRSAARFNEIEKMPSKKREFVRRVYLVQDGYPSGRRRKKRSRNLMTNQVRSKPDSDSSANLNLNSRLRENGNGRKVRINKNVAKRLSKRKRSEKMTEGGTKILKYSPENINEDDDEEGNEFDDDGFEDRTSNLRSWNSDDKPRSVKRSRHIYKVKARSADYPEDFLFSGFHQKSHLMQSNRKRNKR